MPVPLRLLLVDDHPMVRAGVVAMLNLYPDFTIIAQAGDGAEAVRLHAQHQPDLTLMDVRLPGLDGIQALQAIREAQPDACVVMMSSDALQADVSRAQDAGAAGYLVKTSPHAHFARELRHAHEHGWCQPFTPESRRMQKGAPTRLSARELEVLECLRRGLSNNDIGKALNISPETAISHVKALLTKMSAANRTEAVSIGYETGLLRVDGGSSAVPM